MSTDNVSCDRLARATTLVPTRDTLALWTLRSVAAESVIVVPAIIDVEAPELIARSPATTMERLANANVSVLSDM